MARAHGARAQMALAFESVYGTAPATGYRTNMRQVFDLADRIVVFRRGRIVANLAKGETDGQDVVAYITGAKTGADFAAA